MGLGEGRERKEQVKEWIKTQRNNKHGILVKATISCNAIT